MAHGKCRRIVSAFFCEAHHNFRHSFPIRRIKSLKNFEKPLMLLENNTLAVDLRSNPDSGITLQAR
jgi:hypothetical protein